MGKKSEFYEFLASQVISERLRQTHFARVAEHKPPKEDLEIFSSDSGFKVGIGEVKAQLDEKLEALNAEISKQGRLIAELPGFEGIWDLRVKKSFRVSNLSQILHELFDENRLTDSDLASGMHLNGRSALQLDLMEKHQIRSLSRIGSAVPAKVYLHSESTAAFIPDHVENLDQWLRGYEDKYKNSLERLRTSDLEQKHLFLWLSDETPTNIREPARWHPEQLPRENLTSFDYLTHLWLGISLDQAGNSRSWLYRPIFGWELVLTDHHYYLQNHRW